MQYDPTELYNQAEDKPEIVERLKKKMEELAKDVGTTVKNKYFPKIFIYQ